MKKKLAEMTYILNERNIRSHFYSLYCWLGPNDVHLLWFGPTVLRHSRYGREWCASLHNVNCIPNSTLIMIPRMIPIFYTLNLKNENYPRVFDTVNLHPNWNGATDSSPYGPPHTAKKMCLTAAAKRVISKLFLNKYRL